MATNRWFFSTSQIDLVTAVLDRIIPANETMPGAGQIALDFLDGVIGRSPTLKRSFSAGLSAIEVYAQVTYQHDFVSLRDEEKDGVLRNIETAQPAFFEALRRQTYNGYYTNSRIIELLGLEDRPPQPKGHHLEPGNLGLIENVKNRGIVYRSV
jgi:hypothetical protein